MIKRKLYLFILNRVYATKHIEQNLTVFGIFLIFAYPGFYIINSLFVTPEGYENLPLRISIGVLGGILCIRNSWPSKLKAFLPAYMYFLLIYSLPFFFFFMLFNNPTSNIWQLNTLVGLFLLFLFVSWIDAIILTIIGYIFSYFLFFYTSSKAHLPPDFFQILIVYISPLVYISLLFNQKEHIHNEKLNSLQAFAAAIAHEMRTPLASITMIATALKKDLPYLVKFYRRKISEGEEKDYLEERRLRYMEGAPNNIEKINHSAFSFIDMMLMNLKQDFADAPSSICSIKECLQEAIQEYPFSGNDRNLIHSLPEIDFQFKGNKLFIKHLFFNLIKNSLYYIKVANKGNIFITLEKGKDGNKLYFKDSGTGIPSQSVPYIFDKFYSKTKYGTGIGLAFCKLVMENLGGTISCYSREGEYTEFTLKFPIIDKN